MCPAHRPTQPRSASVSMSRRVAPSGSMARQVASGTTSGSQRPGSARSRRSPAARSRSARRAPVAADDHRAAAGPAVVLEDDGVDAGVERRDHRPSTADDERRHVAADDEDDRLARRPEAGAGSRRVGPRRRPGRGRPGRRSGTAGRRARRGDHDDLGRDGPDGVDGVVEQRPAVDRFGQLVAAEPARPAAGEDRRRSPACVAVTWRRAGARARGRPASGAGSPAGRGRPGSP